MDSEAPIRNEVRDALKESFEIWEEVWVDTPSGKIRPDLICVPRDPEYRDLVFGFEVKNPTHALNFQDWAKVFKQASDYVGAELKDPRVPSGTVRGMFVFPSPPYVPFVESVAHATAGENWYRNEQLLQYAGVIHLAQHFRVGHAHWHKSANGQEFRIAMGPNPIWAQNLGWHKNGKDLLNSWRLGSQVKGPK